MLLNSFREGWTVANTKKVQKGQNIKSLKCAKFHRLMGNESPWFSFPCVPFNPSSAPVICACVCERLCVVAQCGHEA